MIHYFRSKILIGIVVCGIFVLYNTNTVLAKGCWTKTDASQNEETVAEVNQNIPYGVEGHYNKHYYASGGADADRIAYAKIHIYDHDTIFKLPSADTDQHYSKGYKRENIGWTPQSCVGDGSNHAAPADNTWSWAHDGDCSADGWLDANNWDLDAGTAGVWFTASLKGSGKSDLDAEVTQTATLTEGESVTVSGKVETGGGGGGVSWTSAGSDQAAANGFKTDSAGNNEAFSPGDFVKVRGVAGARAWIVNEAHKAEITAKTELKNWQLTLINGGTHNSCCDGVGPPHGGHGMCN